MGAWIASCKLIVGITSDSLLVKKPNPHLIEPIDVRMQHVRNFLSLFKPGLELDTPELKDVYGPTGYDPNVQALVVSKETVKGGEMSTLMTSYLISLGLLTPTTRSCLSQSGSKPTGA